MNSSKRYLVNTILGGFELGMVFVISRKFTQTPTSAFIASIMLILFLYLMALNIYYYRKDKYEQYKDHILKSPSQLFLIMSTLLINLINVLM